MPRAPKEPPRIPGYEIVEAIGSGGQGSVWRARQLSLDRIVAIKVLWAEDATDPALAQRFIAEARISSKLNHPNIIQVIDVGETDGTYWYAMEFVAGVTALDLFRERGPLPEGEVLEIAWQVAQALQHGVDRGLIHGDLKPENILITPEGVAKVVDFGLARLSRKKRWGSGQNNEQVLGTEGFVAPEILENKSTGDARTDLFALGVTLFELLTTTLPPAPKRGSTLGPDPRERRPNVTKRTAELMMRLLAPDPLKRPESPAKVLEELGRRSHITVPATVSAIAPVKPVQSGRIRRTDEAAVKSRARWRIIATASVVVGLALIFGAVMWLKSLLGGPDKPVKPHEPPAEARTAEPKPPPPIVPTPKTDATPKPPPPESRATPVDGHRISPPIVTPPPKEKEDLVPPNTTESRKTEPEPPAPSEPPRKEPDPSPANPASSAPPPSPPPEKGLESLPAEPVAVTSSVPAIRVYPPATAAIGAAWTVIVPAGEICDLRVHAPRGFEAKETTVEVQNEGRAKGLTVKAVEPAGTHLAAFRGDRAAQWGPREFTLTFKHGSASSRLRLRVQVVRPVGLSFGPQPALKEALAWLERHQGSNGSISASDFPLRCQGDRKCDGVALAESTPGVTALAVLAALRSGESGEWVRSALAWLVKTQSSDGRFGAELSQSVYTHMIATEAVALGWHLLGGADLHDAAQNGVTWIESVRNTKEGGGAWRYRPQDGDNDTSVTIWAMRALLTARFADLKVSADAMSGGATWIRRATETNRNDIQGWGRVGYKVPGELSSRVPGREVNYPPTFSEALTAGGLSVALLSGDRKWTEEIAQQSIALVLLCRPYWDHSTPEGAAFIRKRLNNPTPDFTIVSPRDFYYWQHGTHLMRTWKLIRGKSIPEDKKWPALSKVLTPVQRKDLCASGSWDANDPWGPELGRAGSTAMLALALANDQYSTPVLDEAPPQ